MEIKLRDYQLQALSHYRTELEAGAKGALFSIATGKGKSILGLEIAKHFIQTNPGNIVVLCPTMIIRNQLYKLYSRFLPTVLLDGLKLRKKFFQGRVFLCCYPTYEKIIREEEVLGLSFSMLIIDEVHKVPIDGVLAKLINSITDIKRRRDELFFKVGFTATLGSMTRKKNIENLLEVIPGRTYQDNSPLYEKEELVISLDPSPWRLNLIRSLRKDLVPWFSTSLKLPIGAVEPPVMTLNRKYPIHVHAIYLVVNKLVRLCHGGTPLRVRDYYVENILKSKLSIIKNLSQSTVELLSSVPLPQDERVGVLSQLPASRKIIFVEDRKIGLELAKEDSYFIHSKEKGKVKGYFENIIQ